VAVSILYALDPFTEDTGGTLVLSGSHRVGDAPSDAYAEAFAEQPRLAPGDALVFDSFLFHRAGVNSSALTRRAVNHVYATHVFRQQFDFFTCLETAGSTSTMTAKQRQIAGQLAAEPRDPQSWRDKRIRQAKERLEM
jgi:ectoine hydroxylase-related dioxygenase (phytanoyl-CoA dioxygenase family)